MWAVGSCRDEASDPDRVDLTPTTAAPRVSDDIGTLLAASLTITWPLLLPPPLANPVVQLRQNEVFILPYHAWRRATPHNAEDPSRSNAYYEVFTMTLTLWRPLVGGEVGGIPSTLQSPN